MALAEGLRELCEGALQEPCFVVLRDALAQRGLDSERCHGLVQNVGDSPESTAAIIELKKSLESEKPGITEDFQLERYLVLNSARRISSAVISLPVSEPVRELYRGEFTFFASPAPRDLGMFQAGSYRFAEMCKVASLRRFPAGQMHWELSGFARSLLLRVAPMEVRKVLTFLARRLGGFRPCFAGHINGRRKNRLLLLESEQNVAYYRIAKSMELQPDVLGYVSTSWIYSAATVKVSPHLEWIGKVFLEHGGMIVDLGPESPDCGALVGSRDRRVLWEKGEFQPRNAIAVWPRREMLRWAAEHPEFAQPDRFDWMSVPKPEVHAANVQ